MTAVEPTVPQAAALDGGRPSIGAWAYFEGAMAPIEDANLSLATHALHYGTSASGASAPIARTPAGSPSSSDPSTTSGCSVPPPSRIGAGVGRALLEITLELLRRNAHDGDAYVRPIIYKAALDPGAAQRP